MDPEPASASNAVYVENKGETDMVRELFGAEDATNNIGGGSLDSKFVGYTVNCMQPGGMSSTPVSAASLPMNSPKQRLHKIGEEVS